MKKTSLFLLLSACGSVYAELPAVIDHSSYPPSAEPANVSNGTSMNSLYELMGRLEQLQAEVQQLTGKVDEQAYKIDELKKHQSTLYSDFDERLQGIENKANGVVGSAQPAGAGDVPLEEGNVALTPTTESVKDSASVITNKQVPETNSVAIASDNRIPKKKEEVPEVKVPEGEKQEYQQAYNELRNGHTKQSIEQFNAFLSKYPSGSYSNNAQYWLGEAHRVDQNNDAARKAFNDVIEKYPDGVKVPDALLRLGMLEMEQKNVAKAREFFVRVTTEFPKSSVAPIAVKKLLKLDEVKD